MGKLFSVWQYLSNAFHQLKKTSISDLLSAIKLTIDVSLFVRQIGLNSYRDTLCVFHLTVHTFSMCLNESH